MRVRWNDGDVLTEVDLPMLSSGQRVVIEHSGAVRDVPVIPTARIVPPTPTPADKSLIEAYRERGLRVEEGAPDVSVVVARERAQEAIKSGNYAVALEWAELVLARYPSHPEFLRMKASVLLLIGEKAKAIQIYEKAEEIESVPSVRKKLEELEKED
jgi:tetratricopeptide (TPR) repeat protein